MTVFYTDITADGLFCSDPDGDEQRDLATAIGAAERGLVELAGMFVRPDRSIRVSASVRNDKGVVASSTLVIACSWVRAPGI